MSAYLQREARCPHCHETLSKVPSRKSECPHCGQTLFIRTRPSDREKVIVTEEETQAVEQAWTQHREQEAAAEWEQAAKALPENSPAYEKAHYLAKAASARREYDKAWGYFNQACMGVVQTGHFGLYRNIILDMAWQLEAEGRHSRALSLYCEVHYYDICGAHNSARYLGTPWDPRSGRLAPGVVHATRTLVNRAGVSEEGFRGIALGVCERVFSNMKGPLAPNAALSILLEIAFSTKTPEEIALPT